MRPVEDATPLIDVASASAQAATPSIRALRRPINAAGRSRTLGKPYGKALRIALEHGDRETRIAAKWLAHRLIYQAMASRLNRERGPISRLDDHVRKSVRLFEEMLR